MHNEKHLRSIVKAISWRLTATCATIIIVYIATGSLKISLSVGLVEIFSKLVLYYLHERVWVKIKWGKK